MISAALNSLIRQKLTSVSEISRVASVSPSTVYRWVNGETQPTYDAIRVLIRKLPDPQAQRVLLLYTVRGTPWQVRGPHLTLDANNDGKVDSADALDAMISMVKNASLSLAQIREGLRDTPMTRDEMLEALETLEDVAIESCLAQQILTEIHDHHRQPADRQRHRLSPGPLSAGPAE